MELEKEETKRVRIKRKEERKSLWRSKHTEKMVHSTAWWWRWTILLSVMKMETWTPWSTA